MRFFKGKESLDDDSVLELDSMCMCTKYDDNLSIIDTKPCLIRCPTDETIEICEEDNKGYKCSE